MEIKIDKKLHKIVYIEYQDGLPFDVKTICYITTAKKPYWRIYDWDFFPNNGDRTDLRAYNSGSGGSHKQLQAPQWADGYIGKFWMHDSAKFKGKPKNYKRLNHPIKLQANYMRSSKTTTNPFKACEITHSSEYCDRCGHSSTEFCYKHKYDDKKGNPRYIDDNSYAD